MIDLSMNILIEWSSMSLTRRRQFLVQVRMILVAQRAEERATAKADLYKRGTSNRWTFWLEGWKKRGKDLGTALDVSGRYHPLGLTHAGPED